MSKRAVYELRSVMRYPELHGSGQIRAPIASKRPLLVYQEQLSSLSDKTWNRAPGLAPIASTGAVALGSRLALLAVRAPHSARRLAAVRDRLAGRAARRDGKQARPVADLERLCDLPLPSGSKRSGFGVLPQFPSSLFAPTTTHGVL